MRLHNRFAQMDDSTLHKRIFNFDKQRCNNNNWSDRVSRLLNDLGLSNFWENNYIIPIDLAKQMENDHFEVDCVHHCSTKPKLRTYESSSLKKWYFLIFKTGFSAHFEFHQKKCSW